MTMQADIDHSLKREAEERAAARIAPDLASKASHAEMADRYADRAWGIREQRCADAERC